MEDIEFVNSYLILCKISNDVSKLTIAALSFIRFEIGKILEVNHLQDYLKILSEIEAYN